MNLHHSDQRCVKIVSLGFLSVEDIDGMGAARNGEDGLWREEEKREKGGGGGGEEERQRKGGEEREVHLQRCSCTGMMHSYYE